MNNVNVTAPVHSVWCSCHLCKEWVQKYLEARKDEGRQVTEQQKKQ